MESEGTLPCSQDPATGPHPETEESSPHPHTTHSDMTFPLTPTTH